jgi:hypothetical protein
MSYKQTVTDEEKERIIRECLEQPGGPERLAASMAVPIRCGGMGYYDGVAFITFGGYPYPEVAASAARRMVNGGEWMQLYREENDKQLEMREPIGHWDAVEHRDEPDYLHVWSLGDVRRSIRDYRDALAESHERCDCDIEASEPQLCETCRRLDETREVMFKMGEVPKR